MGAKPLQISRIPRPHAAAFLFLASTAALYFELVIIRYLGSEVRVFAYLKNMALIASFFGIGLGMILGTPTRRSRRTFAVMAAMLFLLIAYASVLLLTHLPMPTMDFWQFSFGQIPITIASLLYVMGVLAFLGLIVGMFLVLGGFVGEYLRELPQLKGYGVNLLGSLVGILLFTLLSFLYTPPWVWLLIGFLLLAPFFARDYRSLVIFGLIVIAVCIARPQAMWSPYYRIALKQLPQPPGWMKPRGFILSVNYDYFQKALDLSPEFIRQNPGVEPNQEALPHYELPYKMVPNPGNVLIVGAGTGNDVAAALRHGAQHVDAVEIDPLILQLGKRLHPEHPYASPKVTIHNDDARAFFKKTKSSYDLIIFGYLDSHTMLSSYSSVRLENNVYTLQSLEEAKRLLRPGGTMVLAFAAGRNFVSERIYAMLNDVFGKPPLAYWTSYDSAGVVFMEGDNLNPSAITNFPQIGERLRVSRKYPVILATDQWPFLFLTQRRIPIAVVVVLLVYIAFAALACRRLLKMQNVMDGESLHMFFLGAGFLLLETKGVTELSLLFGGTWITNTIVIAAFLIMAIAANTVIMFYAVPHRVAYVLLFLALGFVGFFPYSMLDGFSLVPKILAAGLLTAIPVFFSGLIFSRSFQRSADPGQALGMNLLGAVIGGALENLVMIGGTPVLGVLAIILYVLSAVVLLKNRKAPTLQEAIVAA